ncbi:hypothetical protein [Aquabacterium sp.]|uniref:hypothetical protein n=1 Tax=Aquabacterium sp. TaxID=1872578 RepID=UPI003B6F561A
MRAFGLLSILIALVIVGVLAKKQLSHVQGAADSSGVASPQSASAAQSVQRQIQNEVNGLMQDRASQVDRGMAERQQ